MEAGSQVGVHPTAVEYEPAVENVYDAPYITVNRVDGDLVAEVAVHPFDEDETMARIKTAIDVAASEGWKFHAAHGAEFSPGWMRIFFSPYGEDE